MLLLILNGFFFFYFFSSFVRTLGDFFLLFFPCWNIFVGEARATVVGNKRGVFDWQACCFVVGPRTE